METEQLCVVSTQVIAQEPTQELSQVPVSFLNLEQDTNTDTDTTTVPSNPTIETQPVKCNLFTCNCTCFDPKSIDYDPRCCGTYHVCCRKPTTIYYRDDSCLCCRNAPCSPDFKEQCCYCKTIYDLCDVYITSDSMTPNHSFEDNACCTVCCFPLKFPLSVPFIIGFGFNKIMNIICCTHYENYLL